MWSRRLFFAAVTVVAIPLCITACRWSRNEPTISFSLVPVADPGGPESLEPIGGSVRNAKPRDRVALYSFSFGFWWIQPFSSRPFTSLASDLSWTSSIHLGRQYAALLVDDSYKPPAKLEKLPAKGAGVLAIVTAAGAPQKPVMLHFNGYDWEARQLSSNWGGKLNPYDPNNAWVDQTGFLHLRITRRDNEWLCADIGLKESLGQGSYSFTVRGISGLDPAAVLQLYTWDHFNLFNGRFGVDVSRWGDPNSKNGQFVVHPSYEPHNIHRFEIPPGAATFSFHWRPGKVSFEAVTGKSRPFAEHTFTSGVPQPADEKIHISLYVYGNSHIPMSKPAEVIIERFQYAP